MSLGSFRVVCFRVLYGYVFRGSIGFIVLGFYKVFFCLRVLRGVVYFRVL